VKVIHVDEAAKDLKAIIQAVLKGEDTYICLDNPERRVRLLPGTAGSLFWMSDDFDEPLSDFKEYMFDDPTIRPYEEKDYADLIKLSTELQRYEQALDNRLKSADDALSKVYFEELTQYRNAHNGIIYVAEFDQRVVGMISLYCEKSNNPLSQVDDFLYISEVIVSEAYRRRNIATHLIKRAEDYARQMGMQYVRLHVLAQNEAALGAYRKAGYEVDLLRMIKALD
jgi:ribosomal protein S18 acetylase RimI-like enzyme